MLFLILPRACIKFKFPRGFKLHPEIESAVAVEWREILHLSLIVLLCSAPSLSLLLSSHISAQLFQPFRTAFLNPFLSAEVIPVECHVWVALLVQFHTIGAFRLRLKLRRTGEPIRLQCYLLLYCLLMWWQISASVAQLEDEKTKAIFNLYLEEVSFFLLSFRDGHFRTKKKDEEEARPGCFEAICIFKEVMESFFRVLPWLIWKMLSKSSRASFDGFGGSIRSSESGSHLSLERHFLPNIVNGIPIRKTEEKSIFDLLSTSTHQYKRESNKHFRPSSSKFLTSFLLMANPKCSTFL